MSGETDWGIRDRGLSGLHSALLRKESDYGLFRSSIDGRLLEVNPAMVRILGYDSAAEMLDLDMARDIYAEPAARSQVIDDAQARIKVVELIWRRKDGTPVIVRVSAYAIHDAAGRTVAFEGYVEDITAQKQMQEALRQTNEELQAIYDGAVDGILLGDAQTRRFVGANAAISRMLGYSQAELLSMGLEDICFPEHVHLAVAAYDAMARGQQRLVSNIRCRRKDGSPIFLDIGCNHLVYRGRPCLIGFFRDVTERREAEESLRQERRVLKQLLEMHEQERQLVAYEIHDGLTQQLAGAILQMQAYSRHVQEKPDEAQKEFDRGMDLLGQSMAEARRVISGLRPPILDESGVVAAIEHLVWDARSDGDMDIEFHADVEFDRLAPPLESTVYRIVHEALANSRRHSKSDRLVIKLFQQEERLCLEIRDWGIGFDLDEKANCRGVQSIVQRVRIFGGQLDIQSGLGEGTCITVELPLVETVVREDGNRSP